MTEVLYHSSEPDNHSIHGAPVPSAAAPGSQLCSFTLTPLPSTPAIVAKDNRLEVSTDVAPWGDALRAKIEVKDRRGRAGGTFQVEQLSQEVSKETARLIRDGSPAADVAMYLAEASEHAQARAVFTPPDMKGSVHEGAGGITASMCTSAATGSLREAASGLDRFTTTCERMEGGSLARLTVSMLIGAPGQAPEGLIELAAAGKLYRFALDDIGSAEALNKLSFGVIDDFLSGGSAPAIARMESIYELPPAHDDTAGAGEAESEEEPPQWQEAPNEADQPEERQEQPREEEAMELTEEHLFQGETREHELDCGSKVTYFLEGRELEFVIESCSERRNSDRVVYKIEAEEGDKTLQKRADHIFARLISGDEEHQRKALRSMTRIGTWEAVFHKGKRQHEPLVEIQDLASEIAPEDSVWSHFPNLERGDPELALLNGLQHGILTVPGRALHESSAICFIVDSKGDGKLVLGNGLDAQISFALPSCEETGEEPFGRRQLLKSYLRTFLESPSRLISELMEDCDYQSSGLDFPYSAKTYRAYSQVGELLAHQISAYQNALKDEPVLPAIEKRADGLFEITFGRPNWACYEMKIVVDENGPVSLELKKERPIGPSRILGKHERHTFSLRDNEIEPLQLFRKFGPLADLIGGEHAHRSLLEYLREASGQNRTVWGQVRKFFNRFFG